MLKRPETPVFPPSTQATARQDDIAGPLFRETSGADGDEPPTDIKDAVVWAPDLLIPQFPRQGDGPLELVPVTAYRWQVSACRGASVDTEGPIWRFVTDGDIAHFRRGDTDNDGKLTLSDPIASLGYLFQSAEGPGCLDAVDANDSGAIDVSDPIYVLIYLFLGGMEIPAPGSSECGPDPSEIAPAPAGDLGCIDPGSCSG